jgi:hypothetical protein
MNSQSKAFGLDLYIGVLTSPIPMIPMTGWLPEPVDWVTVVAIFAGTLLGSGGLGVRLNKLYSSKGRYASRSGSVAGRR